MNKNGLQKFEKLPKGWKMIALGEVLPILYGKGLTKAKRDNDGPYAVYGSSGQVGNHSKAITEKSALIIGRKGSVGEVYYSRSPCWPIDTTYYVEEKENIELHFFEYLLKGLRLSKLDKSTAIPGLSRDDYNNVQVAIAPLNEQKRIVQEIEKQFSRLDEAVANLKRIKSNLKRYKASVLKAAVEGKLTEEWRKTSPDVEPANKLLKRILVERRKKWEATEFAKMKTKGKEPKDDKWKKKYKESKSPYIDGLPSIPSTWVWATPEQLAAPMNYALAIGPFGSNLKVSDYRDSGVPLVFVRNIRSGVFAGTEIKYVSKTKASQLKAHAIREGDVLITKMGDPPGDVCKYPNNMPRAIITADCIKWTLSKFINIPELFVYTINSQLIKTQILKITKGVAQLKVSLGRFKTIAIPVPPSNEQNFLFSEIERLMSGAAAIEKEIDSNLVRADRLRQSILKKAFSGKLVPREKNKESNLKYKKVI